ncbi:MAG TPA: PAS domain-containing protein [Candidatus Limnocylindrales bacterium]|nr:PAS domain-containing protein [Candidatus Limnocylindrales bacterium]
MGRRETETLDLQDKSASLLEEYEKKLTEKRLVNDSQFVLVPSGKAFSNRLRKSIENSLKSICIIAHQKTLTQFLDYMNGTLKGSFGKEVNVRILTEKRRNSALTKMLFSLQKRAHFENRFVNILPPFSLVTFDEKEILLSTKVEGENDSALSVYSNNSSLAELSQSYFNDAWFSAVEPPGLAFKRSKLQFDNLFANMNSGFAYCKMIFNDENKPVDFVYSQINDAFERIMGLDRSQVIGKRVSRAIPGFEKENRELFEIFGRVCRSQIGEQCEIFLRPLNCWQHMSIYSPKRGFIAVLFEDITRRKKSELELKQRHNLLESLGENVDAGLAIIDKDFRIVWANKMLKNVGALPGDLCYQKLAHAEAVCSDCGVAKIFDQNVPVDIHEYKGLNSKGETNWVELRVTPLKDEKGNVTSALELAVSINERKKAEYALKQSEKQYHELFTSMTEMFQSIELIYDKNGKCVVYYFHDLNPAVERFFGKSKEQLIGKRASDLFGFVEDYWLEFYDKVAKTGESAHYVNYHASLDKYYEVYAWKIKENNLAAIISDITNRKEMENEQEIMVEFLRIANMVQDTNELIEKSLVFFQEQSGCEAVGIRLKKGEDYPYYETSGFPPKHVLLENSLCARDGSGSVIRDFKGDPVIECMCGNVICGRFDPSKTFFTEKGSFWTNSTTRLLTTTTDADRQVKTRNRCNGEGYESVALVALRVGEKTLGLLQLNDKRVGMFKLKTIQMWERIADHLALALSKTITEESLEKCLRECAKSD